MELSIRSTSQPVTLTDRPRISFDLFNQCPAWKAPADWVLGLIDQYKCRKVLEIGSGANPTLSPHIVKQRNLRYVANDIDPAELAKADGAFERWVGDVAHEVPSDMEGSFDLIFSKMVNEHIKDGRKYHSNIMRLLAPGGVSAHCFSTLYSLPFVVNRLLPDTLTNSILGIFDPRDRFKRDKFPAYYSWSRGPSRRSIAKIESLGFEIVKYVGYYGHGYYWRWPLIQRLEMSKARALVANPVPALSSYAMLIARRRP